MCQKCVNMCKQCGLCRKCVCLLEYPISLPLILHPFNIQLTFQLHAQIDSPFQPVQLGNLPYFLSFIPWGMLVITLKILACALHCMSGSDEPRQVHVDLGLELNFLWLLW